MALLIFQYWQIKFLIAIIWNKVTVTPRHIRKRIMIIIIEILQSH